MANRMTDQEWEAQNGSLHPDEARARGLCWHCSGHGANYTAFGGIQRKVTCPECRSDGEARR
jgi:DnaJ-class molecular chaperone